MNTKKKRRLLALICVFVFAIVLAKTVGYDAYALSIPSDFQKVGQFSAKIKLNTEVSGRFPHGSMHSTAYTNGETILLVQRMSTPTAKTCFKPLNGEKVTKWGKDWYKNTYSMDIDSTTLEFDNYNNFLKEKALLTSSSYLVEMYDSLVTPTSVARVLAFTSKEATKYPAVPKSTARYYIRSKK
ncbi:hypothetical protein [Halodesulfovibrio marinisediminis]|uniref:Uncharacterized protein n=1 Tax=Halodesulfovibrio marinisediminis DSM 17456 TaxID=1121457 RepID=A0A1N6DW07_9BACT|nr:hypothetical protein [Halodesulfovibrio marinisediminis]SIN74978.1 hypothetical protein SAMN02745161_0526 [Halodesulfovibrio marinisediminis DSM 17456]